jgi:hypothetical protein
VDDQGAGNVAASGVYWIILLTTLMVAIDALGIPVFSRWIGGFASHLPRLAMAVGLMFGGIVGWQSEMTGCSSVPTWRPCWKWEGAASDAFA